MKEKFEYKNQVIRIPIDSEDENFYDGLTVKLNKLGNQGWEVVHIDRNSDWGGVNFTVILKRKT